LGQPNQLPVKINPIPAEPRTNHFPSKWTGSNRMNWLILSHKIIQTWRRTGILSCSGTNLASLLCWHHKDRHPQK